MTRVPPVQVTIAVMMTLAAAMIGVGLGSWIASAVIISLMVLHVAGGFHLAHKPRGLYGAMLVVPFAMWYRSFAEENRGDTGPTALLMMMGAYTLALGTYHLLCAKHGGRLPHAAFCAVFAFAVAGTAEPDENAFYLPLVFVFMPLVVLAMRQMLDPQGVDAHRWRRFARIGIVSVATILLAFGVEFALSKAHSVDKYLMRVMRNRYSNTNTAGFGRRADLNAVSDRWNNGNNDDIMLWFWSEENVPYMRGVVFDKYEDGQWDSIRETQEASYVGRDRSRRIFNAAPVTSPDVMGTMFTAPEVSDTIFAPMDTHQISTFSNTVIYSEALTMRPARRDGEGGYGIYLSASRMGPPTRTDSQIPPRLRERLAPLTREIMATVDEEAIRASVRDPEVSIIEGTVTAAKINAVAKYFHEHYEYKLGVKMEPGKDPVLRFVEDARAGHCEYFAAATVMMLRSVGIPARYVTGFVMSEEAVGDLWIARRKDAHAWVEADTNGLGWMTVEPTPPGGMPAAVDKPTTDQIGEFLGAMWRRIKGTTQQGGVAALIALIWEGILKLIDHVPAWLWLMIVIFGLAWSTRNEWLGLLRRDKVRPVSASVKALQSQTARSGRPAATTPDRARAVDDCPPLPRACSQHRTARRCAQRGGSDA